MMDLFFTQDLGQDQSQDQSQGLLTTVDAEEDGGSQGHFTLGHTSKVRKLLCSSGNNSLSGKLGDLSCSSTYRPEKRRSLFSCMSRVSRAYLYFC
jgi:hypothetical protein